MKDILVVDDEEINRSFLVDLLRMHKIPASQASNGQDAVEKWRLGDYSAILMDIQMPILDGYAATREIRQLENKDSRTPTPIIAVTANNSLEARQACFAAGIDDFVAKPVIISELLRVVLPLIRHQ
ncbi:MAG: response regulator [Thermodesulfobacteriota bacterium]